MIPTNLDALAESALLSAEGKERLAAEVDLPPMPAGGDESIASFVSRRLGREAYERLVEPLMTGIYGGDGEQLSLQATFPQLRALELEHGSVLRGLAGAVCRRAGRATRRSSRSGREWRALVAALVERARADAAITTVGRGARACARGGRLRGRAGRRGATRRRRRRARGACVRDRRSSSRSSTPELAAAHAEIPYASSAIVTLAYRRGGRRASARRLRLRRPARGGLGRARVHWTSSKWEGRAPAGTALLRVYAGRFGGRDVTTDSDDELVALARDELRAARGRRPSRRSRAIHRWPRGMPQYVLGHPERLERIDAALGEHPGLALAGAAYRGVGIPDCIHSGEEAARVRRPRARRQRRA